MSTIEELLERLMDLEQCAVHYRELGEFDSVRTAEFRRDAVRLIIVERWTGLLEACEAALWLLGVGQAGEVALGVGGVLGMKESEYILVKNLASIDSALAVLRHGLHSDKKVIEAMKLLYDRQEELYEEAIELTEVEE